MSPTCTSIGSASGAVLSVTDGGRRDATGVRFWPDNSGRS